MKMVKIPDKWDAKKLQRVRYLLWMNRITAPQIVRLSPVKFDPSYVYHVASGRSVSRGMIVEKAIAKALGKSWEKI